MFLFIIQHWKGSTAPTKRRMPTRGLPRLPGFYHNPDENPPGGTRVRAGALAAGDVSVDDFSLEFDELDIPFCTAAAGPFFCGDSA